VGVGLGVTVFVCPDKLGRNYQWNSLRLWFSLARWVRSAALSRGKQATHVLEVDAVVIQSAVGQTLSETRLAVDLQGWKRGAVLHTKSQDGYRRLLFGDSIRKNGQWLYPHHFVRNPFILSQSTQMIFFLLLCLKKKKDLF
jgi:hypothetical protein